MPRLTVPAALELARRAMANLAREYPNHPQLLLDSDADLAPPRAVHPCFFGCFDWHSAVHTHWLLVRLRNVSPDVRARADLREALARSLAPANVQTEADYLARHRAFERPYGLAWLLALTAECAVGGDAASAEWAAALAPAAAAARSNLAAWLPQLRHPVRSGTHNQTAFALTLIIDAARAQRDSALETLATRCALDFFSADSDAPLGYEPSGEDFLSPTLMEADLMRRVLDAAAFATWLGRFLPALPTGAADWLPCATVGDESDGKLVHLHGLNLSRAWNLANVAHALPAGDRRIDALSAAAARHLAAGVEATLADAHYAGGHWLPSFAVYALTRPGAAQFQVGKNA